MIMAFKGKSPKIGENVYIAPTAAVIGDVTLADGVSVWFGTVLRGDMAPITVGENTNIQDNCTVHTDEDTPAVIGRGVTVGHNAVVHGCTVADRCLVGIGAVVLNRAEIGEGAIVAAGSVVRENQAVGPWELVAGIPAALKKKLPELADGEVYPSTADYVALSAVYR